MRPIHAFLLVAILAACLPAHAQTVQKCAGRGGIRFQSEPCARGERTLEVWAAVPEVELPPPAGARAYTSGRRARSAKPRGRRVVAASASGETCEQARNYRDAVERQVGLARTYDLLSLLDRRVFDACRY